MTAGMDGLLAVTRGDAPLVVSIPHAGTWLPDDILPGLESPWLARRDTDWWIARLYAGAAGMGATVIRTEVSRTVIDVNRDPSGASLYPGMATTGLCPTETFDGDSLYRPDMEPDAAEIDRRRAYYFDPYHVALAAEIARLRAWHPVVVVYDCHSIRSKIPRLFDGLLPNLNIGTNGGASCAPELTAALAGICRATDFSLVVDGRFKGGWITRHYGAPTTGVHAVQIELACRGYMDEPETVTPDNWPSPYDSERAAPLRATVEQCLAACLAFAAGGRGA